jgi:NACHT domain
MEITMTILDCVSSGDQPSTPQTSERDSQQLDRLANVMLRVCAEAIDKMELRDPWPLPVRWASSVRPVHDEDMLVSNSSMGLSGNFDEIANAYHSAPSKRLVVLGEPGSGKSALAVQLVTNVLEGRRSKEPVLILLAARRWNPRRERPDRWISRQLAEMCPGLRRTEAERLFAQGLIVPVIDGLDEIFQPQQALHALNTSLAKGCSLVVTCRTDPYERAVTDTELGRTALSNAAVIELAPLGSDDVVPYLYKSSSAPGWSGLEEIAIHVHSYSSGPLAQALSNPLMVSLTRAGCGQSGDQPELLAVREPSSQQGIEDHLLGVFFDLTYEPVANEDRTGRAKLIRRQFASIARLMYKDIDTGNPKDFGWFWVGIPERFRTILIPFISFVLGWITGGAALAIGLGVAAAAMSTMTNGWPFMTDCFDATNPLSGLRQVRAQALACCLILAAEGGTIYYVIYDAVSRGETARAAGMTVVLAAGLAAGTMLWTFDGYLGVTISAMTAALVGIIFVKHYNSVLGGVAAGLTGGLILTLAYARRGIMRAIFGGMAAGVPAATMLAVFAGLASLLPASPWMVTVAAFGGAMACLVAILPLGGLGDSIRSVPYAILISIATVAPALFTSLDSRGGIVGVIVGMTLGLVLLAKTDWANFCFARAWLALIGPLPFRLMRWLDDVHRCGVLRQVGGVYQFRHPRMGMLLIEQEDFE